MYEYNNPWRSNKPWWFKDDDLDEAWLDMMLPTMSRDDPLRPKFSKPKTYTQEEVETLLQVIAELKARIKALEERE